MDNKQWRAIVAIMASEGWHLGIQFGVFESSRTGAAYHIDGKISFPGDTEWSDWPPIGELETTPPHERVQS